MPWGAPAIGQSGDVIISTQASAQPRSSAYLAFSSPGSAPRSEERRSSRGRLLSPQGLNLSRPLLELLGFPQISVDFQFPNSEAEPPLPLVTFFFFPGGSTQIPSQNPETLPIVTLTRLPAEERAEGEFKAQPKGKAPKNSGEAREEPGRRRARG